ncbi:MAG: carbohydrate-binding family 9-like protein [Bacteroidetes bacterium]|nr:carbohydrate-binding family 9-like protein [Bacteroidota bacterium]
MRFIAYLFCVIFFGACSEKDRGEIFYEPPISFQPRQYICYQTNDSLDIDGMLNEDSWRNTPWTEDFRDISGGQKPSPPLQTRTKMMWNEKYFYIAAQLEEPHIWANLTRHDAVIFQDDDFEVFIDPDGDGQNYFELELNAFNTSWDLLLLTAYRVPGLPHAVNSWEIMGLQTAVHISGTINDASDVDSFWTVEMAIPWESLIELAPRRSRPKDKDQWRINFSRVDWHVEVLDGKYQKKKDPDTGKAFPEENWVWSPTGKVNMHMPEWWGYVQFSKESASSPPVQFIQHPQEKIKWALWQLYYMEMEYFHENGHYVNSLDAFELPDIDISDYHLDPTMVTNDDWFEISVSGITSGKWHINSSGRVWRSHE